MEELAVVFTTPRRWLAEKVRSLLEGEGIETAVDDDTVYGLDLSVSHPEGGLKIKVAASQRARAERIARGFVERLRQDPKSDYFLSDKPGDGAGGRSCPQCEALNVPGAASCHQCGQPLDPEAEGELPRLVYRTSDPAEARRVRRLLEGAGIPTTAFDARIRLNPLKSDALGGLLILVPEGDAEEAERILERELGPAAPPSPEEPPAATQPPRVCGKCYSPCEEDAAYCDQCGWPVKR